MAYLTELTSRYPEADKFSELIQCKPADRALRQADWHPSCQTVTFVILSKFATTHSP